MQRFRIIAVAIIVILFIWITFFVWYLKGGFDSDNQCEDEIIELKKEIRWWKNQVKAIWEDRDKMKKELNEKIIEKEKAEAELFIKQVKAESLERRNKLGIAEAHKKMIIQLYKEWHSQKKIAWIIGCGRSTIQRAVQKRWLKR